MDFYKPIGAIKIALIYKKAKSRFLKFYETPVLKLHNVVLLLQTFKSNPFFICASVYLTGLI